jgi:broad specificity phosphatase PhoE
MKIYILRHEDRTQDCSFFAPLTEIGLNNAKKLVPNLTECNINLIFCSPFIRTLQTIYPYVNSTKIKINIEYALSEIHHIDIIPKKAVGINLPEYLALAFNYNCLYKSILKPHEIIYPENEPDVLNRVRIFLKELILQYCETDFNIVIVTHQSLCFGILKVVNKLSEEYKNKIDPHLLRNYPKGKLCLVFNNGWTFKLIN